MPPYAPQELQALVAAQAKALGTRTFLTEAANQRLREMWCAAQFGIGYANNFGPCAIDIATTNEQREFDFHLLLNGDRLPFQIAEVLDSHRRRGDEYCQILWWGLVAMVPRPSTSTFAEYKP